MSVPSKIKDAAIQMLMTIIDRPVLKVGSSPMAQKVILDRVVSCLTAVHMVLVYAWVTMYYSAERSALAITGMCFATLLIWAALASVIRQRINFYMRYEGRIK